MIGLDFPVKPQWVHDVHQLWQPAQPINDLIQAALSQTMQELGGEKTRRKSLTIILRHFVATEGSGQSRRTVPQDAWVAYSRVYPASTMAPAYLAHLIAQNDVAQAATRFVVRRCAVGDALSSGELRRHVASLFGERKVVTNAASAFLRTLQSFGVLATGQGTRGYHFAARLPVSHDVFPLIVWACWQRNLAPQIDLDSFEEDPALALLEPGSFGHHWQAYQPRLWSLEERLEGRRATLKHTATNTFQQALLDLLPPVG